MGVDRMTVVVQSRNPLPLGEFWAHLLECDLSADTDDCVVEVSDRAVLLFLRSTVAHHESPRQHLDVASASPTHQAELVERALALGARHVDIGQGDVPWRVMADPDGNAFCILEPREDYLGCGPLAAVVTHTRDPLAVGRFWAALVDAPAIGSHPEFTSVRYSPAGPALEFVRHPNPPNGPGRLHLRLAVTGPLTEPSPGADAADPCPVCGESSVVATDPERNQLCESGYLPEKR
ncbi:MAG: VOC family protein [Mycobacterium kyogaense]|uniref:VOC family protein n=1 Tax=Mycobacterium kyogaense TaxID=2212479 RepID=UPI002FF7C886